MYGSCYSVKSALAFIIGVSVCLYDLYYPPMGRIFDYVALLLFGFIAFNEKGSIFPVAILSVVLLVMLNGILGFHDYRSLFGLCFGLGVFFLAFKVIPDMRLCLYYSIGAVVTLVLLLQVVQLLYYNLFDGVLDFTGALGSIESRIHNDSIHFFRPSGLFQEPNTACVFFAMAFLVFYYSNQELSGYFKLLVLSAALIGLALSNSLWGWVWFALLFCFYVREFSFRWVMVLMAVLVITNPYWLEERSVERIVNIFDESSLQERYVGAKNAEKLKLDSKINSDQERYVGAKNAEKLKLDSKINSESSKSFYILFGYGLSNRYFQAEYGANAISYLVFAFGFISSIALLTFLGIVDTSFAKIKTATVILICTTYPYFNYAIFWVWLALYMYDDLYKGETHLRDFFKGRVAYLKSKIY